MITRDRIEPGQYPDWAEFERKNETQTEVRLKEGFYLSSTRIGQNWRFRESGTTLFVEYYNGSDWVEMGQFTA